MVGMNKVSHAARVAAAGLALSLLLTTCEPLALRDLAEKLAQGGAKHVYFTDRGTGKFYRSELDGANRVELFTRGNPAMLAVDPVARKLCWTNVPDPTGKWEVLISNLDGSDIRTLYEESTATRVPRGISANPASDSLFWAASADLVRTVYTQSFTATEIALPTDGSVVDTEDICYSPALDRIFIADLSGSQLHRIRTNGALEVSVDVSAFGTGTPRNIAVDGENGFVYWSDDISDLGDGLIGRCDTDLSPGSMVTFIPTGVAGSPRQLVVDTEEGYLFWTDDESGTIKRANLDGTGIVTIASGLTKARGIALDPVRR